MKLTTATTMLEQFKASLANLIALNVICISNLLGNDIEEDGYYRVRTKDLFPEGGIKTYGADPEKGWTVDVLVVRDYDGWFIFGIEEEDVQLDCLDVPAEVLMDIANATETKAYELKYGA